MPGGCVRLAALQKGLWWASAPAQPGMQRLTAVHVQRACSSTAVLWVQFYIDEMAKCLMEGAEDPASPAHARMLELIDAMVRAHMRPLHLPAPSGTLRTHAGPLRTTHHCCAVSPAGSPGLPAAHAWCLMSAHCRSIMLLA